MILIAYIQYLLFIDFRCFFGLLMIHVNVKNGLY